MTNLTRRHAPFILLAAILIVVSTAGGAVAAKMITGKDVKNSSLTGKDVKDRSLGLKELSSSARAALKGNAGTPGISGYVNVSASSGPVANGANAALTLAYCPQGKRALGGGAYWVGFAPASSISGSGPFKALYAADGSPAGFEFATATDASGWGGRGQNNSGASSSLVVFVTCANVS